MRGLATHTVGFKRLPFGANVGGNRICLIGFFEHGDGADRAADKVHLRRKRVAEQPGDTKGNVHPRTLQFGQWRDRETGDPARGFFPQRTCADQRQRLRNIVTAGAHVGGPPGRQRNRAWPLAGLLPITFDKTLRRELPDPPCRRGRHRPHIDGKEIASGRQYVRPAPRRRAGRAGPHEPPIEPAEKAADLGSAAGIDGRPEFGIDPAQHLAGPGPSGVAKLYARDQLKRKQLDTFDSIT